MVVVALVVLAIAYFMLSPLFYPPSVRECIGIEGDHGDCLNAVAIIKQDKSLCDMQELETSILICESDVAKAMNDVTTLMRHDQDFNCDFNDSGGCGIINDVECTRKETYLPYKDYQKILYGPGATILFSYDIFTPLSSSECIERFANHSAAEACADPQGQAECYRTYAIIHDNLGECELIKGDGYFRQLLDKCRLAIAARHDNPDMCRDSENCWWYFAELKLVPSFCDKMQNPYAIIDPKPKICKAAVLAQLGQ